MENKFGIKKSIALIMSILMLGLSVFVVSATETGNKQEGVTTFFHEQSGTLIVSGTGSVGGVYPASWEDWAWPGTLSVDTSVRHIVIEKGITSIGNSFNDMHNLESISIPEGLTKISDSFMNCTALKSVDFPESLEEIAGFAFMGCSSLKNIDFKNRVRVNGGYSGAPFYKCSALKEVYLPGGSFLSSAFVSCSSLENVYIGREGLDIESVCYDCIDFDQVVIDSLAGCNEKLKLHYVEGTLSCSDEAIYWDRVLIENMPDKIALKVTNDGINVNWNGKIGANVYHLYRKAKGDKKWTKIGDTELTYYDDNTVKSGVEYSYLLKVDDDTDKLTSSYTRFIGTPEIKSATSTSTGIKISWSKVAGATKYRIYRRTRNGEWKKAQLIRITRHIVMLITIIL